ncbi:hypothetical protein E7T06_16800 [Deinococcus sp. Arct2-2]|uniref:hypothetical protein n=1 Tax=Deinococcus sp. Arct2-2 TaxID=2568653 RepID=UPI0010A59F6F|nr:hypothetical protein [Deinococcus sp. Arct2-2]THF68323.1 hypothetical protein E7T06_16800 [Deinococcus sp. Arct2-2]
MPTVAELLTPLALCGRVEDQQRRAVLMTGVMADLSWSPWSTPTLHEADPAWGDVQALIVAPSTAPQRAAPRPQPQKAGLWLFVSDQLTELEQGECVEWSWLFGGQEQLLIGMIETNKPLVLRVHRSFYDEAGRQVPEFLRAYDGLLLLGFSARQARALVQRTPSKALLEVVVCAYRQKDELHNPRAYVQKLVQPLKVA